MLPIRRLPARHLFIVTLVVCVFALVPGCAKKTVKNLADQKPATEQTAALEQQDDAARAGADEDITRPEAHELAEGLVEENPELPSEEAVAREDATPLTATEQEVLEAETPSVFNPSDQERKEVQVYFKYFTHTQRKTFERWLKRAEVYLPYIRKVFEEKGIPLEIAYLPMVESGYNCRAYSRAGAAGMWQFMPYTGRKYGLAVDWWIDERRDPYQATYAAADYLLKLYELFGDWQLAMAAYNAGEGKISRAIKGTGADDFFDLTSKNHLLKRRARLKRETQHYVPKFLAVLKIMNNLESLGFEPLNPDAAGTVVPMEVKPGTDLLALAKSCGVEWKTFVNNNRAFRRYVSPPDRGSMIYLEPEHVAAAQAFLAKPGSTPYEGYQVYRVRSGDSWYRISRRFGVPISVLKKVNKRSSNLIKPGQRVVVPRSGHSRTVESPVSTTRKLAQKRGNYVVQRGDTLWAISRRYDVSLNTLRRANGMSSRSVLKVGQKLYIPDSGQAATQQAKAKAEGVHKAVTYTVRRGDSVWTISRKFGVSHLDILRWNKLSSRTIIQPGDRLTVYTN